MFARRFDKIHAYLRVLIVAGQILLELSFEIARRFSLRNHSIEKVEVDSTIRSDEGIGAFRELRQLVANADAELDKVDLVLDRADQATTAISETSRRTHEAVQDPVIRSLAIASGSSKVTKGWLGARRRRRKAKNSIEQTVAS